MGVSAAVQAALNQLSGITSIDGLVSLNSGTLQWFNLAPTVNAQAVQPSAAGTFI